MANDKLSKLTKYVEDCKNKLSSPPSPKHASHPEKYYAFWRNEIKTHSDKIDELKMSEPAKK